MKEKEAKEKAKDKKENQKEEKIKKDKEKLKAKGDKGKEERHDDSDTPGSNAKQILATAKQKDSTDSGKSKDKKVDRDGESDDKTSQKTKQKAEPKDKIKADKGKPKKEDKDEQKANKTVKDSTEQKDHEKDKQKDKEEGKQKNREKEIDKDVEKVKDRAKDKGNEKDKVKEKENMKDKSAEKEKLKDKDRDRHSSRGDDTGKDKVKKAKKESRGRKRKQSSSSTQEKKAEAPQLDLEAGTGSLNIAEAGAKNAVRVELVARNIEVEAAVRSIVDGVEIEVDLVDGVAGLNRIDWQEIETNLVPAGEADLTIVEKVIHEDEQAGVVEIEVEIDITIEKTMIEVIENQMLSSEMLSKMLEGHPRQKGQGSNIREDSVKSQSEIEKADIEAQTSQKELRIDQRRKHSAVVELEAEKTSEFVPQLKPKVKCAAMNDDEDFG
eukprot:CAMPEP_0169368180 /NCGR_PEP_ID=MMETSP1017-20121227/34099_1 /TAXON_ID=342587 /ORGANISM="Karlodinium micrum, Strain CCMP2283" /LENGTH=437 /DNA_ID=CAMNT_0009466339 /DNA_START=18 /DNA_END=1329 /DNA_ORIENTATION=+